MGEPDAPKLCPFCECDEEDALPSYEHDKGPDDEYIGSSIVCGNPDCGARGPWEFTMDDALRSWNRALRHEPLPAPEPAGEERHEPRCWQDDTRGSAPHPDHTAATCRARGHHCNECGQLFDAPVHARREERSGR